MNEIAKPLVGKGWVVPFWLIALSFSVFVILIVISYFTGKKLDWSPLGWDSPVSSAAAISKTELNGLAERVLKLENQQVVQIAWMDVRVQTPGGPNHASSYSSTLVINVAAKDTEITLPVPSGRKVNAAWVTPVTEITDGSAAIFKIEAVVLDQTLKLVGHANAIPGSAAPVGGSIVYRIHYAYTEQ